MQTQTKDEHEENIIVVVRVKPLSEEEGAEKKCLTIDKNSATIDVRTDIKTFNFDYIANEKVTQDEIFERTGRPLADACIRGYNTTVFAYGQTGAGKTFTIQGPTPEQVPCEEARHKLRGLMPRIFEYISESVAKHQQEDPSVEYIMKCSYLEIYQETIGDLLDPKPPGESLHLREDIKRGVYVEGLVEETAESSNDLLEVLKKGAANRHIGATAMNKESSRSHSVFTLTIESKSKRDGIVNILSSRFHIIDLAGSERQKTTDAAGDRLKEAGKINKSLSALGNVINSLVDISQGKSRHVHYRDSKLTFLLKDSLGGNSKTVIIANVAQSATSAGESLSTLNFAKRAKLIKNKAVVNEDTTGTVLLLQQEIKRLKAEIADLRSKRITPKTPQRANSTISGFLTELTPHLAKDYSQSDLQVVLQSTVELRNADVKMYEELLRQKEQALDMLKKCVRRCKHDREHSMMMLKFKEAAIDKLRGGKSLAPGEEVEALRNENKGLQESRGHELAAALKFAEQTDLNEQVKLKFNEQNEYIQQMNDILKKLGEEKSEMKKEIETLGQQQSKGAVKTDVSEVEEMIAKIKLEYGEKIEELSRRYIDEKTERERLQEACEKKDEEILSETMKQAEKEQYFHGLIANYEEQLHHSKISDEDVARLKIQNIELLAKAQEADELKTSYAKAMATLEEMNKTLAGKAEENSRLIELIGQKESAIKQIMEQHKKECKDLVLECEGKLHSAALERSALITRESELQGRFEQLIGESAKKDKKIQGLSVQIEETEARRQKECGVLEQRIKAESEGKVAAVNNATREIAEIKEKCERLVQEREGVIQGLNSQQEETVRQNKRELDELERKLRLEYETKQNVSIAELAALRNELSTKSSVLASSQTKCAQLESDCQSLQHTLRSTVEEHGKTLAESKTALETSEKRMADTINTLNLALDSTRGKLETEILGYKTKLAQSQAELDSCKETMKNKLATMTKESEEKISEMAREVEKCVKESRAREERTRELESALKQQKTLEAALKSDTTSQLSQIKSLQEESRRQKLELSETAARLQKSESAAKERLTEQSRQDLEEVQQLETEAEKLREKARELENEMCSMTTARDDARAKLSAAVSERTAIQSQLQDVRKNYSYQVQELTKQQAETLQMLDRKNKETLIDAEKRHAGNLEVLAKDWDQKCVRMGKENEELKAQVAALNSEKSKCKNEVSLLATKLEKMESERQEEKKRIEERYEGDRKEKEETIGQLRQENKERETAIMNSQATMQDIRLTISLWQEKVDEKKKLLEESKETIRAKETQIAYLKEQMKLLMESNKSYIETNKTKDDKSKKEVLKLQVALKAKEKELAESKDHGKQVAKRLEEENRAVKTSNLELVQSVQDSSKYISDLKEKLRMLEAENSECKAKAGDASGKENQWYLQASKWKVEVDKLKRDVARLETEKSKLNSENDLLSGHTNANQKIHLHQKIKDENNMLRTVNYKLSEEIKMLKEKGTKMDKDYQYLQSKYKVGPAELLELPSKYELKIAQLQEQLQKEAAISIELSKLPEIMPIYSEKLEGAEPIEQIAKAMDYLIQLLRTGRATAVLAESTNCMPHQR